VPRSQGPLPARPAGVGRPVTATQSTFALRPSHARERRAQHVRLGRALQNRGIRPSHQPFHEGAQPVPPPRSTILSAGLIPFPLPAPCSAALRRTLTRTRRQESSWVRKRSRLHARPSSVCDRARRRGSSRSWSSSMTRLSFAALSTRRARRPRSHVSDSKVRLDAARISSPD
jgi:hypothetical protein